MVISISYRILKKLEQIQFSNNNEINMLNREAVPQFSYNHWNMKKLVTTVNIKLT